MSSSTLGGYSNQNFYFLILSLFLGFAHLGCGVTFNHAEESSSLCLPRSSDLVAWWDGDSVNSSRVDDLLDRHNGLSSNLSTSLTGKVGDALSILGYKSSVGIPHHADLNFSQALTVSAWVKADVGASVSLSRVAVSKSLRPSSNISATQFAFKSPTALFSLAKGLHSAGFDGRYLYFIPNSNASYFVRYDTYSSEDFSNSTEKSWQAFDTSTIGYTLTSRTGTTFDGRYFYFTPSSAATTIARYDTQSGEEFSKATQLSWSVVDLASSALAGAAAKGYNGGGNFDGRYVYFIPIGAPATPSGLVARYDSRSQEKFSESTKASWSFIDVSQTQLGGANASQFTGSIFDGRYLYLVPNHAGNTSAVVARYDTQSTESFESSTSKSWAFRDIKTINTNAYRYAGGVFDGRYVYFAPNTSNSTVTVARYDVLSLEPFESSTAASWSFFSPKSLNANAVTFDTGLFDGRYVYLIPRSTGVSPMIARYDTQSSEPFASAIAQSWNFINIKSMNASAQNYIGGTFDGKFAYLVPFNNGVAAPLMRIETTGNQSSFELKVSSSTGDGRSNIALGPSFQITTDQGFYQVVSPNLLDSDWHLLTGVYDGSTISLYIDGTLRVSRSATGKILESSSADVQLGSYHNGSSGLGGALDEAQIYSKALSSTEVAALYEAGSNGMCK
jgi:hypothetical protein